MIRKLVIVSVLFLGLPMQAQLFEGFEGTFPPAGWLVADNGTGTEYSWKLMLWPPFFPCEADNSAYIDREEIGIGNTSEDWLISPSFTIGTDDILTFCSRQTAPGDQGTLFQVRVSTTSQSDLAGFTTIWSETETQLGFQYQQKNISLTPYIGQSIFIAFVRIFTQPTTATGGDRWILDGVALSNVLKLETFSDNATVDLFPNPVNDDLTISIGKPILSVRIYNSLGQFVETHQNSDKQNSMYLNVSNLPTGQYFIEVNTEDGTYNEKFLKR